MNKIYLDINSLIRFGFIGTIGFIVDASILYYFVNLIGLSIELSRLISFSTAVFVTWLLNRKITFKKKTTFSKKKEYSYYFFFQAIGASINYGVFIFLIKFNEYLEKHMLIALAIAAFFAMFFNFYSAKKFIYS